MLSPSSGGDRYASLLRDTVPLQVFRAGSGHTALTIDGDMPADKIGALFDSCFWLQAWVTAGDGGPRIPLLEVRTPLTMRNEVGLQTAS